MDSSYRGLIFPIGVKNWFEFTGVSNKRGFEKSGEKLQCWNERETTIGTSYREARETDGSRNWELYCNNLRHWASCPGDPPFFWGCVGVVNCFLLTGQTKGQLI